MTTNPALHPQTPEAPLALTPDMALTFNGTGTAAAMAEVRACVAEGKLGRFAITHDIRADFDLSETRSYFGEPGWRLARYLRNCQSICMGKGRIWSVDSFGEFSPYFWTAYLLYDMMKRALAKLVSPVILEEDELVRKDDPARRYREGRYWEPMSKRRRRPSATPRKHFKWGIAPPSEAEWARIDTALGFDVRGTAPSHILPRIDNLRRKQIDRVRQDRGLPLKYKRVAKPAPQTAVTMVPAEVETRDYQMSEDFFAIWPPMSLPKEPPMPPKAKTRYEPEAIDKTDLSSRKATGLSGTPRGDACDATATTAPKCDTVPRQAVHFASRIALNDRCGKDTSESKDDTRVTLKAFESLYLKRAPP